MSDPRGPLDEWNTRTEEQAENARLRDELTWLRTEADKLLAENRRLRAELGQRPPVDLLTGKV